MTDKAKIRRYTTEEITEICQKWAEDARNFGYAHPEVIDALNAIPCTSFRLRPGEIKAAIRKVGDE